HAASVPGRSAFSLVRTAPDLSDAMCFFAPISMHSVRHFFLCTAVSRRLLEHVAQACSERVKPVATTCVERGSKVVANLVRTLLRSPRCTAHHQLMGSSDAHAQEHDSYWYCGGPVNTSIRRDDECRCGRQNQTLEGLRPESFDPSLQVPEPH